MEEMKLSYEWAGLGLFGGSGGGRAEGKTSSVYTASTSQQLSQQLSRQVERIAAISTAWCTAVEHLGNRVFKRSYSTGQSLQVQKPRQMVADSRGRREMLSCMPSESMNTQGIMGL
jgi:hypothetical protein